MRSTAEILEGNKVKLSVEVDEEELEGAVTDTVKRLQQEVRVPGFRPGKVPRRVLEVRLGTKAIREEVLRSSLPDYYAQAVEDAALDTIAAPEIDITSGEDEGLLAFDAVVEIRPKVSVAGYEGLQLTLPPLEASEEDIDRQIDRLREQFAQLNDADRAARTGDVVTIDVTGTRDGEPIDDLSTTDYVYEVGSAMVAPGVDEKLVGAKAGDIVEVAADEAPGGPASLKVLVKLVREKILPEADDDWASEASEFETVGELRQDLVTRMNAVRLLQARRVLQEGVVAELAKLVDEEIPETLVDQELAHQQDHFLRSLAESKISLEQYLQMTGQEVEQIVAGLREKGTEQVRADLALRALAEAESIEVTDEDLASEIAAYAESIGQSVADVARQFAENAGLDRLRSEIRNSKAVTWLVEHVEVVDEHGEPVDRALLLDRDDDSGGPDSSQAASEDSERATVGDDEPGETEEEQA